MGQSFTFAITSRAVRQEPILDSGQAEGVLSGFHGPFRISRGRAERLASICQVSETATRYAPTFVPVAIANPDL